MAWEISKRFTVANQTWFLWVDRHCGAKPRWALTSAKDGVPREPCSKGSESQSEAMQPLVEAVTRWIRTLRVGAGLSQEEFAAKVRVRAITVSRWERGEQLPSQAALSKIAKLAEKACSMNE
jgi:putative transcriptional regulator